MRPGNRNVGFSQWIAATIAIAIFAMPGYAFGQQVRPVKSGIELKLSENLINLQTEYLQYLAQPVKAQKPAFNPRNPTIVSDPDFVVIDTLPMSSTAVLRSQLQSIGAVDVVSYKSVVSARLPISAIGQLAQLSELRFARPYMAITTTH